MIALRDVLYRAGDFSLGGVSFQVPGGAYGVLMGRTGSGKTTLLEIICGLRRTEGGAVFLGGKEVTRQPINQRGVGYVPQEGALFPRMTVQENLAFPLFVRGRGKNEIKSQIESLAERLSITHLLPRRAVGLSGGESQRVALARALAASPSALLLDEPLSALDDSTRSEMIGLLKQIQSETNVTVLHVTHSRGEAEQLADTLIEIDHGRVVERPLDGMPIGPVPLRDPLGLELSRAEPQGCGPDRPDEPSL